jgi:hypothetical protein
MELTPRKVALARVVAHYRIPFANERRISAYCPRLVGTVKRRRQAEL